MIRAVIDTNVLVSGLLAPKGNEALVILALHQGLVRPFVSAAMLEEYAEVLVRPKFGFSPVEITSVLSMFERPGTLIVPRGRDPVLPDSRDAKFLHCATDAQAEYLVTGNKRHFPQEACSPVRIVNARELLDTITLDI